MIMMIPSVLLQFLISSFCTFAQHSSSAPHAIVQTVYVTLTQTTKIVIRFRLQLKICFKKAWNREAGDMISKCSVDKLA